MSGMFFVIDHMNFINRFLKSDCKNVPFTRICKDHFIPEKIKEFEETYKKRLEAGIHDVSEAQTNENFKGAYGEKYKVSTLKKEVQERYYSDVKQIVESTFQCRIAAFNKGEPCYKAHLLLPKKTHNYRAGPEDFDISGEKLKEKLCEDLTFEEHKLVKAIVRLQRERIHRSVTSEHTKVHVFLEAFDSLNTTEAQHLQLKWYVSLSEELNKNVLDLTQEDLVFLEEKVIKFHKEQKEKTAKIAADKLMAEEFPSKKKGHQKQKKSSFRSKKEEKSDSSSEKSRCHSSQERQKWQQEAISQFASQKPLFELHQRVERWWKIKELEDIKNFKDFDSNGVIIKRYENMSEKELEDMKMRHSWPGIDRFLSDESLKETYSYPYSFDHNGETKEGRALFVSTVVNTAVSPGEKKAGNLQVGIGKDGVVYHAFLDFMDSKLFLPQQMIKHHDDFASPEDLEESKKWDLTTSYSFSLIENNVIQLEIGEKKEERTLFYIYPVKEKIDSI